MRHYLLYISVVTLILSCTSSRPDNVLDADDMEDVLYDVHIAHFIGDRVDEHGEFDENTGSRNYAYMLSVLKKHNVSQARWDSSMVYYAAHAEELEAIYKSLYVRMESRAAAMGIAANGLDNGMEHGDSADIWSGDRQILLTSQIPNTTASWTVPVTMLKPGERLQLWFNAAYVNSSAPMRATAVMAMQLNNDSILVSTQSVGMGGMCNITIADYDNIGIKSLRGFFMIHQQQEYGNTPERQANVNETQILSITGIRLLHTGGELRNPKSELRDTKDELRITKDELRNPKDEIRDTKELNENENKDKNKDEEEDKNTIRRANVKRLSPVHGERLPLIDKGRMPMKPVKEKTLK